MSTRHNPEELPLTGVRIMDMTHVWSGPMATRVLAGLGAEVIKIENLNKPDALRGTKDDIPLRYPDRTPGAESIDRNAWFNTQNVDKKSLVLDLKTPEGLNLAHDLAAISDVVIANYRPGVLDRMGLGFADLKTINPRIILVEMPGYTADSPQANAPAFGAQFDAQSGSATLTGSGDGPLLTGYAIGDPTAGLLAGSAALSALLRRDHVDDPGCHIVIAQSEAMMPLLGEYYLAESAGHPVQEPINGDRRFEPHGVYKNSTGEWIAITVRNDVEWHQLRRLLNSVDGTLSSIDGISERKRASAKIDAALGVYFAATDDASSVAASLQEMGVPAAPVQGAKELCEDPQLAHSEYFNEINHLSAGVHNYPSLPIDIDGVRTGSSSAAPRFKEDTYEVLSQTLGLKHEELMQLANKKSIGVLNKS